MTKEVKRIVLLGPESTGKTVLAEYLAGYFSTLYVPELARSYIENLNRPYSYNDVLKIAKLQIEQEKTYLKKANHLLIYDTWMIITKVWMDVVYGESPKWMADYIKNTQIDLFLLCNTDIPWYPDEVRENGGEKREELFHIYRQELETYNKKYEIIEGTDEIRKSNALKRINQYFGL